MALHRLRVVPRDVAAGALGLLLHAPAPSALAELVLTGPNGGRLVLGVLGASHVVTARAPARLTEQVSCDAVAGGGTPLAPATEADGYRMTTRRQRVPATELTAAATELRARADAEPAWICGAFPGDPAAITALTGAAVPGGWTWRTWHLYPGDEEGVIVTTRSRWTP